MKATRDQLKGLVKELLLEILQEGLGQQRAAMPISRRGQVAAVEGKRRRPTFDPRLDTPVGNRTPTEALKEAVRLESGGNAIMADILADTAMTTLPSQLSGGDSMGRPTPGGAASVSRTTAPVQQEQFAADPSDIFDGAQVRADGSSHWADLAFMSGKKPL